MRTFTLLLFSSPRRLPRVFDEMLLDAVPCIHISDL